MEEEQSSDGNAASEFLYPLGSKLEEEYVHSTYEHIATHFSETRYKGWPSVNEFLSKIEPGSLLCDVGCGNGKYLGRNRLQYAIGCDRSSELIRLCARRGFETLICDARNLPFRNQSFDYALSIAVIHHFSTEQRRKDSIKEMLRMVRYGGRILITVWAMEQEKRKFDTQDLLIPWHLQVPREKKSTVLSCETKSPAVDAERSNELSNRIYQRYYHLFRKGELDELVMKIPEVKIVESKWDHDNWYIVIEKILCGSSR